MGGLGLPELLVMFAPFLFVGFIVWAALGRRRDRQSKNAEVRREIIGKFSSSAEMHEFLKSSEGRALFGDLGMESGRPPRGIRERAISRIGIGIVLIVVGGGLMVLAHYSDQAQALDPQALDAAIPQPPPNATVQSPAPPSGPILEVPPGTGLPAAALFLTGVGLIISGIVTLRLTSREDSKS